MIAQIARYCAYLALSVLSLWGSDRLGSTFLADFLTKNLITLLVALIAINTATRTALLAKLKEFGQKHKIGFAHTSRQLRIALYEQFILLAIGVGASILATSATMTGTWLFYGALAALGVAFLGSLQIIFDTGQAVLILLDKEQQ